MARAARGSASSTSKPRTTNKHIRRHLLTLWRCSSSRRHSPAPWHPRKSSHTLLLLARRRSRRIRRTRRERGGEGQEEGEEEGVMETETRHPK